MRKLPVRWGLSLANRGALFGLTDIDELIESALFAEQSGVFESVWVGDSLIHKPRLLVHPCGASGPIPLMHFGKLLKYKELMR